MDGVLFHGMKPIDGAVQFMDAIYDYPHVFITNNPIRTPDAVADKMEAIGFTRPNEEQIITSGEATALWLSQQKANFRYFAVGAEGLHQSLQKYGIEDKDDADFVIVGEGAGIDYDAIIIGINLILKSRAKLISTNPDSSVDDVYRGKHAVLPGGGALVAPFTIATGQQAITIGKPNPLLYEIALQSFLQQDNAHDYQFEDCLMIGDRPDTDIIGAQKLSIQTALVRTGRFAPGQKLPKHMTAPDWDVDSLKELLKCLQ
ncbi:MAG: HAD-IIA family hydrolase [Gammaproteobacteria bacterium]|nr:HAD-IIA family hydrolase [Gammaproteobacteria bacterium]